MQGDEGLTQEQMQNASIAGLAVEIGELRRALNEQAAMIGALHRVFLEKQPGQADTLAERLLRDDMLRRAAEITEEQWVEKLKRRGAVAAALMTLGAFATGIFAVLLKLSREGGQP